jgi:transcriptional regulator with XRE-family HTH domain
VAPKRGVDADPSDGRRAKLGEELRRWRESRGLSLAVVGPEAGIGAKTWAKVEKGKGGVSAQTYHQTELRVDWPEGSMANYLHQGGALPKHDATATPGAEGTADRMTALERRLDRVSAQVAELIDHLRRT